MGVLYGDPAAMSTIAQTRVAASRLWRGVMRWVRGPDVRFVSGRNYGIELPGECGTS